MPAASPAVIAIAPLAPTAYQNPAPPTAVTPDQVGWHDDRQQAAEERQPEHDDQAGS